MDGPTERDYGGRPQRLPAPRGGCARTGGGLSDRISCREANAEALPFPDASFDATISIERGCADDTLYRRCREAGLELLLATPQFGATTPGQESLAQLESGMQAFVLAQLDPEEAAERHAAVGHARQDGTLALAQPDHCAVGRRP